MKRLLAAMALSVGLLGCAQVAPGSAPASAASTALSPAQLQANWLQACLAYEGAQAAILANIDRLNHAQLEQVYLLTHQITPLCLTQPTDLNTATVQITAAVTTLTILEAAHAAGAVK